MDHNDSGVASHSFHSFIKEISLSINKSVTRFNRLLFLKTLRFLNIFNTTSISLMKYFYFYSQRSRRDSKERKVLAFWYSFFGVNFHSQRIKIKGKHKISTAY